MIQQDFVLIAPGGKIGVYQGLHKSNLTAIHTPIEALMVAEFARKKGFSVSIIDANALNMTPDDVAEAVKDINPYLTVIFSEGNQVNASTQTMPEAGATATAIKNTTPDNKVMITGHHPTALPKQTLTEENVDFVACGEPYYTMVELVQALKATSTPNFSEVRGLWWKKDGISIGNRPAPLVQDINDEIGGFAFDLLPPLDKYYRAHNWQSLADGKRTTSVVVQTTFGCPFHCYYCMIQSIFRPGEKALGYTEGRNSYRYLSPKIVVNQLEKLINQYGFLMVRIYDELFAFNPSHVKEFCNEIINRGLAPRLNIWAYARINTTKDWMLDLMYQAGFKTLAFGVESGSKNVRDHVDKGFGQDDIFTVVDKVHKSGLEIIANYIYGLPWDTPETMQETLDLAKSLNTMWYNGYCAMAYPGSALYKEAVEKNWQLPNSWSGYSQHSEDMLPLSTEKMAAGEVISFRDKAFTEYFSNPVYLAMVEKKFGSKAVEDIRAMTAVKLTRKFAS